MKIAFLLFSLLLLARPYESFGEAVRGEYLVQYNKAAAKKTSRAVIQSVSGRSVLPLTLPSLQSLFRSLGFSFRKDLSLFGLGLVSTKRNSRTMETRLRKLKQNGIIKYYDKNYIRESFRTPNDLFYSLGFLWGLSNSSGAKGGGDIDIDAPQAWDVETGGSSIIVAIIDSGIDYTHPDLIDNMWINEREIPGNNIDDDQNGVVDDVHGFDALKNSGRPKDSFIHGTHLAGIIGAKGDNGIGVTGVNWNARLMALRFIGMNGQGTDAGAISCIEYALKMKKRGEPVRIMNLSWGSPDYSQSLAAVIKKAISRGVFIVAAAGNDGKDNDKTPIYPASLPLEGLISVAALNRAGQLASFSNYGRKSVDIAAPGSGIWSTIPFGLYLPLDGTSMAAPFVSGVASLMLGNHPGLSPARLKERLIRSARRLPSLDEKVISGGIVNARNAL